MSAVPDFKRHAEFYVAVRQRSMPSADDPRAVEEKCETCGRKFLRWKGRRRHYCPACSAQRMVDRNTAVSSRAGKVYEKTVVAQCDYWLGEADRLGLIELIDRRFTP